MMLTKTNESEIRLGCTYETPFNTHVPGSRAERAGVGAVRRV
jgi:hypothetical protein